MDLIIFLNPHVGMLKKGVSIHALVSSVGQAKLVKVFVTQLKRYGNTVD